jgi:predicted acyltransferase
MGVLQRIGLCFILVAIMLAFIIEKWLLFAGTIILIAYWFLLLTAGDAPYTLENNVVRHIDMVILGSSHMWQGKCLAFEPEGLVSNVGASITVLSAYLVCSTVLLNKSDKRQIMNFIGLGAALFALGLTWSFWHPINKALWTGSFVLISSAAACLSLAIIILLWQVLGIRLGLNALKIYGSNPIFIYVAAWISSVFLSRVNITIGEHSNSIQSWLYSNFQSIMSDKLASLLYASLFTLLFYFIALVLYKKRIFIKL